MKNHRHIQAINTSNSQRVKFYFPPNHIFTQDPFSKILILQKVVSKDNIPTVIMKNCINIFADIFIDILIDLLTTLRFLMFRNHTS